MLITFDDQHLEEVGSQAPDMLAVADGKDDLMALQKGNCTEYTVHFGGSPGSDPKYGSSVRMCVCEVVITVPIS